MGINVVQIHNITSDELFSNLENLLDSKLSKYLKSTEVENYSVQTISKKIGCTDLTTYGLIKKGILPASKIGRKYLIKKVDFDNALQEYKSLKYKR